ncbi:MAG TPA: hypothetical protein VMK65_03385 [Longimicrobiales bacterium]|nr:hypothetical protein [Longimicrobiales bacterium]
MTGWGFRRAPAVIGLEDPTLEAARARRFRHAAFAYLHVGLLYEAGVFALWRRGMLPVERGPAWLWLVLGALLVAVIVWALWSWRSRWFARVLWAVHALRLPALLTGAFFPAEGTLLPPSFYLTALVVVVLNLVFLARAGWDL